MSITSMAQDSAIRLGPPTPSLQQIARSAGAAGAKSMAGAQNLSPDQQETAERAADRGAMEATEGSGPVASSTPLSELVKYVPTETIAIYIALQAALGELTAPPGRPLSSADFGSRWIALWVMLGLTAILTVGLSYRAQRGAWKTPTVDTGDPPPKFAFQVPWFESTAASAAFVIWALSLPSTPLRDFAWYDPQAWNAFILLAGTVAITSAAYVLGRTVTWVKVPNSGVPTS